MVGKKRGLVPSRDFTSVPRSRVRAAYALELAVRTRWSLVCTSKRRPLLVEEVVRNARSLVEDNTEADLINDK